MRLLPYATFANIALFRRRRQSLRLHLHTPRLVIAVVSGVAGCGDLGAGLQAKPSALTCLFSRCTLTQCSLSKGKGGHCFFSLSSTSLTRTLQWSHPICFVLHKSTTNCFLSGLAMVNQLNAPLSVESLVSGSWWCSLRFTSW